MAKKASQTQPSLFRQTLPKMPDGYYSSGPNPNLRRFVEEHAASYDLATDEYNVPPFDKPISTTKATAIYNMHTYWSKKPHDAIRQYIRHYTKPGDLVLDPFCGSGGTALAALMEGRKAIAIDLSPAATFITKNYCTPVDVNELQRAFAELERKVKPEIEWLYETRCDRCDGRAHTVYTVHSQVFRCPRCLTQLPLFDCLQQTKQTLTGKTKSIHVCPYCYAQGYIEEIRSQSQKYGAIPVVVIYSCDEGCKPRRGERRHNDTNPKKQEFFQKYDLGKIQEIDRSFIPYEYPSGFDMRKFSRYQRDALRLYGISEVADLYTKRNLWTLSLICNRLRTIATPDASSAAAAIWTSVTTVSLTGSRMLRESKRAIQAGTYYIPQISREIRVWTGIEYNVEQSIKALTTLTEIAQNPWQICISTQSATNLAAIPDGQIDFIFTDPPYGGTIQYGELNYVWEAWLGFNTAWHNQEIIVNEQRGLKEADWARFMHQAMSECYRVLKPGHWISLCYHDTSEGTWQLIQDMMTEVGFVPEQTETSLYIDTEQKSFNQLMAEKVTRRDLVINFRKPRPGEVIQLMLLGDEDQATFTEKAQAILVEALQAHPGATADRLYDILVSRMVRRGEFERHNFEALLNQVAEPVKEPVMANLFEKKQPELFGGHEIVRWYLRATADQMDEAESAKESIAAERLERYMTKYLAEHPEEGGVHYSDLFEQYLRVKDKPRRLMQEWLTEFFFKTDEGTWRPSLSDEERVQKSMLRETGALRRIKRFARALLEGVPPAPHDHPANAATAADWIRQCRRAGLYELGRALYEKGSFTFNALSEEAQLEVEEDYQVCVRRS